MIRNTGYYFIKRDRKDPWEVWYYSQSAGAWLHNQKRYSDRELSQINSVRIPTPDEPYFKVFEPYKYPLES